MVDLSAEMAELWATLAPPAGRSRVVQLVAARRGEGTSTVAREFARYAAHRVRKSVWLVDVDLLASPQYAAIRAEADRYGQPGEAVAATPNGSIFFTVQPPARTRQGAPWPDGAFATAHQVGQARWWVTRFRRDLMRTGQTVHILPSPDYWNALRAHADLVIVDAPSADRSQAALTLAPLVDETVMVVAADQAEVRPPALLRDSLVAAGGEVAGIFLNRTTVQTPGFLKALLP